MPLLRCEIKNEYGLGDPELYEESGSDDPEALLEGVAMAGLVGVLRQIGDLAEFAAEVFHGLHEQIVTTSARGHRLMLCVQQLEIEFPAVEKKVLSQTTHSHLPNNAGIDWHPSNHLDQNLITQQDMPRFVLNSYEESRGPPQLFILDKFDVAGAGACLKRYTDPSLFKTNDSSFRTLESEIQREKKSHKTRKKGTHLMHTKTINSFMKPDEKSIPTSDPKSLSLKRAKLKTRHVNSLTNRIGTSYMECIIDSQIVDQNQNDIRGKYSFSGNKKSVEAALEVHEIVIDSSSREKNYREIKQSRFIIKHNRIEEDIDGLGKEKGMNRVSESLLLPNDEVSKSPLVIGSPTFNDYREFNDTEKLSKNVLHESEGMAVLDMAGSGAGEIGNNVSKFDYDNELENYVDALTAMECEMETDYQSSVPNSPHKESPRTSSDSGRVGKHAKLTPSLDEKCSLDSVEHLGNFIDTGLTEKNEDHTLECEKSLSFSSMNLLEKNSNRDLDTTSLSELPENMEESTPVWPSSLPENMKESAIFMSSDSFKIVNESTKIMPSESPKTMKESAAVKLSETPDNINDNYICRSKESDVLNALHEPCYASYDPQSGSEKKSNIYGASGSLEILDEYLSASEDPNAMFLDQERDIKSTTKGLDEGNLICTDILSKSEETVLVGDSGNPDVLSDAPSPRQMDNNDGLYPIMTYNLIHENELFSENIVDGSSPDAHTHSSTCSIPEKTVLNNFSQDSSLHSVKEPSELINHNLEIDDGIVKAPHFDGDSEDSRHEKLNENVDDDIVYGNIQNLQSKHFPTKENEVFSETKTGDNPCPHLLEVASDTFNDKERNDSIIVTEIPVDSIMIENSASVFCSETSSNSIEDDKSFKLNSISPSSQDTSGSEFKIHDSIQELKDKIQVESVSGSEFKIHDSTQELKNKIDVESLSGSELKMHDSIQESSKIHVESVSGSEFKIHDSTQELKNKIDVESVSGSEFKIHDSTQELKNKIDVESLSGSELKMHDSLQESSKIHVESVSGSECKIHDSTQELKNKIDVESVSGSEFKIHDSTQELKNKIDVESVSGSEFKIHDSTQELKNKIDVESLSGSELKMHDSIQESSKIHVESVSGSECKIHDSTQELKNKIDVQSLSGSELKMHDSIQESSKIHVESVSGSEFKIHDSTQELKNKIDVESVSGSEFKIHDSTQELKNKIDLESVSGSEFKIHDSTQELKNKMHVESVSGSEFKAQEESVSISEFKIHDSTKELKNNKLSSPYDNTLGLTSEETSALLCSKQENENTSSKLGPEDHPLPADMNNHGTVDSTDSFVALVPNNTQIDLSNNTELSYSQSDVREVDMVLINSDQSDGSLAVEFQSSTPEGFEEPDVQQPQIIRKMETPVCLDNSCVSSINVLKELLADETKQVTGVSENGIKKNDSDDSLCDTHHQNHSEVEETYKSIQSSSELFVKSLENISVTNMHTQINLLPQNGLQDSVADTPLPPLPPLQWRLGKHGLGSKIPFGATSNPTSRSKSPIKSFLNSSASGILPLLENNQQPQVNDANSGSRQTVSSNPILFKSVTNDDKQNLSQHRSHGDEKIQSMSLYMPVPSSTMQDGMHQHNHYIPDGEMFYVPYSVTSEINPDQQNGKPRSSSILNRPKNPLIEAVASHDRSTLRKVSEMDLPKVKSKLEENDTLLEQIRNQSFNLKSTSITKPQVNGPSTNLKLAAILEKANAIRQACVGSDEDDDGSWSDS